MALKKLPVARVHNGAVLAEDVMARAGNQVLMARGTVLTKDHLETLRQQRVEIVTIEVSDDAVEAAPPVKQPDPESLKQIVVRQHRWFGDTREDPIMAELFRVVVARAIRRGA